MTVTNFIKERLSYEEYAFSWDDLAGSSNKSKIALKRELSRLVERQEIINLRKGFYIIIPPRYSIQKHLPIQLYIEKLFKHLTRKYYLGLLSAAKFHGASHQQIQRDYIITSIPPILDIKKKSIDIRFFTTSKWPIKNILDQKSDAGYFKISSPALTAVDLIHYQSKIGGLNRILANIEEITEEIDYNDLNNLLGWYPHKSTLQRFGFILDELQTGKHLSEQLLEYLSSQKYYPVLLSPRSGQKPGAVKNPWKVDVNVKLESDI